MTKKNILFNLIFTAVFVNMGLLAAVAGPVNTGINVNAITSVDQSWGVSYSAVMPTSVPGSFGTAFQVTPPGVYTTVSGANWIGPNILNAVNQGGTGLISDLVGFYTFSTSFGPISSTSLTFASDNQLQALIINNNIYSQYIDVGGIISLVNSGGTPLTALPNNPLDQAYLASTTFNGLTNPLGGAITEFGAIIQNLAKEPPNGNPSSFIASFTNVVAVPEPGVYLLLASLLCIVLIVRKARAPKTL